MTDQGDGHTARQSIVVLLSTIGFGTVLVVVAVYSAVADMTAVFGALFVIFVLTPLVLGIVFGLLLRFTVPISRRQALIVGTASLTCPALWALLGLNPMSIVGVGLGVATISRLVYHLPRIDLRVAVEAETGESARRIGLVPVVSLLVCLGAVLAGVYVHAEFIELEPCESADINPVIGYSTSGGVLPQMKFGYEYQNGSVEIKHLTGDTIVRDRLYVTVNRSSVAWRRLEKNGDKPIEAGDTVTVPYARPGETIEMVQVREFRGAMCSDVLAEHTVSTADTERPTTGSNSSRALAGL